MGKVKHSVMVAQRAIYNLIEELHNMLLKGQAKGEERKLLEKESAILEDNNPDFHEMTGDFLDDLMKLLYVVAVICICCIDFVLLLNGVSILCDQYNLPTFLKWFVPVILIVVEITVSYMCIVKERNGEAKSGFSKVLQYFVIGILVGFTVLTCVYSAAGYNAEFDTISFSNFFSGIVLYQAILLLASIFSHVWLIQNSEHIVMAFAYWKYKLQARKLAKRAKSLDCINRDKDTPAFKKKVCVLVKAENAYCIQYHEWPVNFTKAMTNDLIRAINTVMGRTVFELHDNWNDKLNKPNN